MIRKPFFILFYIFATYLLLKYISIGLNLNFNNVIDIACVPLWLDCFLAVLFLLGLKDALQKKHSILRNFPLLGHMRYLLEGLRPEIQQYFIENNTEGTPVAREFRSVVYQRSKKQTQTQAFGTQRNVYQEGHIWVNHSMFPKKVDPTKMTITFGSSLCKKPHTTSVLNISAMSYGSLSERAIESLNLGAKKGNFSHNTGEGGIAPEHLLGADIIWQLGTGYFGARKPNGEFCPETYKREALRPEVKMIELKLSQGAKPGKGGMLPGKKVSEKIAKIRGVKAGQSVLSPSYHKAFSDHKGCVEFIQQLRELSGGKPIGIKLCFGSRAEFKNLCETMKSTGLYPDFIAVDGAEGGTGAAPLEFANSVGTPLQEGLAQVCDLLEFYGLRKEIKVVAAGKIFTAFHALVPLAIGADAVYAARSFMLSLGCIHALHCNKNTCPVGVATTDPELQKAIHIPTKAERVFNYHKDTVKALSDLIGAAGLNHPDELRRNHIFRRMGDAKVQSYEEVFPTKT